MQTGPPKRARTCQFFAGLPASAATATRAVSAAVAASALRAAAVASATGATCATTAAFRLRLVDGQSTALHFFLVVIGNRSRQVVGIDVHEAKASVLDDPSVARV